MRRFRKAFRSMPDPRAANARHDLLEILFIALAAVLCGAESCAEMEEFGHSKEGVLRMYLRLEFGIPSHDTFSRVFRLLDPQAFEAAFRRFMAAFAKANGLELTGVVAIDGKAVRGAYERGGQATPLHLVNVFAVEARMALAQRKAPGRNETAGALEVLDLLCLEGSIVTADALHCHRAFAAAVLERGGDYVLAIKANRGPLVQGCYAAVCALRHAPQRPAGRTVQPRSARSAPRNGHAQYQLGCGSRFSRRRRAGPDHFAPAPPRPACRSTARAPLPVVQIPAAQTLPAGRTQSLGHRERAPLGARRPLRRGRKPRTKGQCSRELRDLAKARAQHPPNPSPSRLLAPQNQARRMGRHLSHGYNQSYAIALRSRGRVGEGAADSP